MPDMHWHASNPQPIFPRAHFLGWYLRHEAACACRPMPERVLRELDAMGIVTPGRITLLPSSMPEHAMPGTANTRSSKALVLLHSA